MRTSHSFFLNSEQQGQQLIGAPTLRLRGDYLAIVTLGFGEIVPIVVRNWSDLTNGAAGLNEGDPVALPVEFPLKDGDRVRPVYP